MSNHDPSPRTKNTLAGLRDRGWVSLRDFTKIADITYQTALRWARLEMINFKQVGGTKRIYEEEIARFLKEGTLQPNAEKLAAEKEKREEYKQNGLQQRKHNTRLP